MKRNHAALTMSEYITLLFTLPLHLEVSEPAYTKTIDFIDSGFRIGAISYDD